MRTEGLRRYEAPLLVKRDVLPVIASDRIGTDKGREER